jgi:hypothetical protein
MKNKKEKKCKHEWRFVCPANSNDCADICVKCSKVREDKSPKPEKKVRIEEIKGSVVIEPTAMNECPYINYGVLAEMKIKINELVRAVNSLVDSK